MDDLLGAATRWMEGLKPSKGEDALDAPSISDRRSSKSSSRSVDGSDITKQLVDAFRSASSGTSDTLLRNLLLHLLNKLNDEDIKAEAKGAGLPQELTARCFVRNEMTKSEIVWHIANHLVPEPSTFIVRCDNGSGSTTKILRRVADTSRAPSVYVEGSPLVSDGDIVTALRNERGFAWICTAGGIEGFLWAGIL